DERNIVIHDFNATEGMLYQRLLTINWESESIEYLYHRNFAITTTDSLMHTLVGEEWAVSATRSMDHVIFFPTNPLLSTPHSDITQLTAQALSHARQFFRPGRVNPSSISLSNPPFVISHAAIGFFIDEGRDMQLYHALVINLTFPFAIEIS
ncbi:hypothetical protein PENTCL1PPCAC_18477, partial [Pristionchus entomophagus]